MKEQKGNGIDIGLYKKFYDIWVRSTSEMLNEMMHSPQFAEAMGKSLHVSLDFKKRMDETLETSLKNFRIPTSSEMTDLSRQIRSLEQKMQGISKKLDDLRAHLPSPTKKPPSQKGSFSQAKK